MEKHQLTYTLILHHIRKKLKLTLMEYCVADCIYHLSNNPASEIKGWCYASKPTIAKMLGSSEQTIFSILTKLIEKKFIEKDPDTKYLKTTEKWYENVVLVKANAEYKETLGIVKKVYTTSKETLLPPVKKLESYNNIYNNNYNKTVTEKIFIFSDWLNSLLISKQTNLKIIGLYIKHKGYKFSNALQAKAELTRNLRAASLLAGYTLEDVKRIMSYLDEQDFIKKWTLETVSKYMQDVKTGKVESELIIPEYAKKYVK
jgi:hypothetical protein